MTQEELITKIKELNKNYVTLSDLKRIYRKDDKAKVFIQRNENKDDKYYSKWNTFAVYFMYDKNNEIVYIGRTRNLYNRMYTHFTPSIVKNEQWKKNVYFIKYFEYEDFQDMCIMEEYYINKHKPSYNNNYSYEEYDTGLIYATNWYGGYRGGISSNISILEKEGCIEILKEGYTAEGDAGRMGGETQYIILVKKPCIIKYYKQGRVYDNHSNWKIILDPIKETAIERPEVEEADELENY